MALTIFLNPGSRTLVGLLVRVESDGVWTRAGRTLEPLRTGAVGVVASASLREEIGAPGDLFFDYSLAEEAFHQAQPKEL